MDSLLARSSALISELRVARSESDPELGLSASSSAGLLPTFGAALSALSRVSSEGSEARYASSRPHGASFTALKLTEAARVRVEASLRAGAGCPAARAESQNKS